MTDREGFEAFCVLAHPRLVGSLAHHTGDRWLAEELTQEALVRAGDRWDRVRTLDSPIGWCFRVGVNIGNSTFRRRGAERRARARHGASPDVTAPVTDPDAEAVRDALALLSDKQRQAIVLRHLLGLTVDETAATMDQSATAIRSLTHRGLAVLREHLGPDLLPRENEEHADV